MSTYENPFQPGDIVAPVEESSVAPDIAIIEDPRHNSKIGKTTVVMAVTPKPLTWSNGLTYHGIRVLSIAYHGDEWSNPAFFRFVERPKAPEIEEKAAKPVSFQLDPTVNDGHTCTGELPF